MSSGIYQIVNTANKKFYIGSTVNLQQRFGSHRYDLRKNIHHNPHLQASWNRHGEGMFSFEVIEYCSRDSIIEREQYYIDTLKPSFNICLIAGYNTKLGIPCSEETKAKISKANSNRKPWLGKTHSEKTKAKISASLMGHSFSQETKEKMSESAKKRARRQGGRVK